MADHITDSDLVDYIAGTLDRDRSAVVRDAIARSTSTEERYTFLKTFSTAINSTVADAADRLDSSFLTDNIMRAVTRQAVDTGRLVVNDFVSWIRIIFKPVMATCMVVILLLAAYNFVAADQHSEAASAADAMLGLPQVTIASAYDVSY